MGFLSFDSEDISLFFNFPFFSLSGCPWDNVLIKVWKAIKIQLRILDEAISITYIRLGIFYFSLVSVTLDLIK